MSFIGANLLVRKPAVQIYWWVVYLRVQSDILSPIHRRLMGFSRVMISWRLLLIAEIDWNSSLSSTCLIIDFIERIFINCVDIISEATGLYASSFSTTSIISIDSKPEDTEQNSPLRRNVYQGIRDIVSNHWQWFISYSFGQQIGI